MCAMRPLILHPLTQLVGEGAMSEGPVMRCAVEEGFVGCGEGVL
jgi:hypothetical protein